MWYSGATRISNLGPKDLVVNHLKVKRSKINIVRLHELETAKYIITGE